MSGVLLTCIFAGIGIRKGYRKIFNKFSDKRIIITEESLKDILK